MDTYQKDTRDSLTDSEVRNILTADVKVYKKETNDAKNAKDPAAKFMDKLRKSEIEDILNKKRGIKRHKSSPPSVKRTDELSERDNRAPDQAKIKVKGSAGDKQSFNNLIKKVEIPSSRERLTGELQTALREIKNLKEKIDLMEKDKKDHIRRLNKLDSYIRDTEDQLKNIKNKTDNIYEEAMAAKNNLKDINKEQSFSKTKLNILLQDQNERKSNSRDSMKDSEQARKDT